MHGQGPLLFLLVLAIQIAVIGFCLWRPRTGPGAGWLAFIGTIALWGWPLAYAAFVEAKDRRWAVLCAAAGLGGVALITLGVRGKLAAMKRAGRGRCDGCGYDLRGLGSGVCPECGRSARAAAK